MRLTSLLTDHAILQRHQPIPVRGWTDAPRTRVRVTLGEARGEGISGDAGDFLVWLPPLEAGGPYTLTVASLNGGETIEVTDILIGEVWLASGQSNMEWTLENSAYREVIRQAHPGQIRMFTVARRADLAPQATVQGRWERSTPDTVGQFSAVASFFGNRLQAELGVPVGIVSSSWGGSFIETWISREALLQNPLTHDWLLKYEQHASSPVHWDNRPDRHIPADPGNAGLEAGWHAPAFDDRDWPVMPLPSTWQAHGHPGSAVMWFRKRVALPERFVGQALTLHLGAVDKHDITYVNGHEVGRTGENFDDSVYNQHRAYPVPATLTADGELVVAVRAYSYKFAGGLTGPARAMRLTLAGDEFGASVPLAGDWQYQIEHDFGVIELGMTEMGHGMHNSPCMCFGNMIAPLLPLGLAGVIWYQGESNAGNPEAYRSLLQTLIMDWRRGIGQQALPFGIVQLAGYMPAAEFEADANWARQREAQAAALELPATGLAVIFDRGHATDVHPLDKETVGLRLAAWALADVYGQSGPAGSPLYRGHRAEGRCLRLLFRNTGGALRLTDGDVLRTLFIAGADGQFRAAQSRIEGDSVVAWHTAIDSPRHARYAWANNPEAANLIGATGLPVGPFRTDGPTL